MCILHYKNRGVSKSIISRAMRKQLPVLFFLTSLTPQSIGTSGLSKTMHPNPRAEGAIAIVPLAGESSAGAGSIPELFRALLLHIQSNDL
jgi:hypothetical protein